MPRKKTQGEFIAELRVTHPNLLVLGEYKGDKEYVTVKCTIHNHTFETKPNWLHHGSNCQKCYDDRRGDSLRKPINLLLEELNKVHNNRYEYPHLEEEYKNNKSIISILCHIHGIFTNTANHHLSGQGCPICNESKLEQFIEEILTKNKIQFIPQYKNNEILGNKSVDFYIPSSNIAIECQGIQHFTPIEHFGGIDKFNDTVMRDTSKYNQLSDNGIRIIYVIDRENIHLINENNFGNIYHDNVLFIEEIKQNNLILINSISHIRN